MGCRISVFLLSPSCSKLEHSTTVLNQLLSILLGRSWKKKEQVNKLIYREGDLLDVGMVVQRARKRGTIL